MNKKNIIVSALALMILMLFVFPVYADMIQDSIQQQIGNQIASGQQATEINPQELFIKALREDPDVRAVFQKFVMILIVFAILIVIDLILRGIAMWKASKRNQRAWFWFLLIVNSLGILPLIYLIIYRKKPLSEDKKKK